MILIDTRPLEEYYQGAIVGAISIPRGDHLATSAGWVIDPEQDDRPIALLARDEADAEEMRDHLLRVGIDNVRGYVTSTEGLPKEPVELVTPEELEKMDGGASVLDVRAKSEYAEGHIPNARLVPLNTFLANPLQYVEKGPVLFVCAAGVRSALACEMAAAVGLTDLYNLEGGTTAWIQNGLPVEK